MILDRIKKIYLSRRILKDMALRQLKAKYGGSKLGLWWAVATPLLLAISINLVFTKVFKIDLKNYAFFVLAGIIPWNFFASSLQEAANSLRTNSLLLKQTVCPREFIPISSVLADFLNFLIGFAFLLPVFIIINPKVVLFLPLLAISAILQFLFILGLGILFSFVNLLFCDFAHFLSIGLMVWFWLTPIFYSLEQVPDSFKTVCFLNPMTFYVGLYQAILFQAKIPDFYLFGASLLISVVFLSAGYLIFIKKEALLLKRI